MLEIIGDSRAVARAAIQLAMTATREEETELKASLTEKDIVGAASDFGGTFVDSMMKMIERAVVAAKRRASSVIRTARRAQLLGQRMTRCVKSARRRWAFPSAAKSASPAPASMWRSRCSLPWA